MVVGRSPLAEISFEIYSLKKGTWSLIESLESGQRGAAIERAKALMADANVEAVGAVSDSFDSATGESQERLIYGDAKKDGVPPLNGMPVRRRPADEKKRSSGPSLRTRTSSRSAPRPGRRLRPIR
jgi:hypothetical protein